MGKLLLKHAEIFLEFKRILPQGSGHHDKGLGLGLAIVDKISRILGHQVAVTSVPGRGSVFSVEVPLGTLEPRDDNARDSTEPAQAWLENARLWVVDNDQAICANIPRTRDARYVDQNAFAIGVQHYLARFAAVRSALSVAFLPTCSKATRASSEPSLM